MYLLRYKSDAFQAFLNFKTQVELQLGFKVKAIQTDWGREYRAFTNFLTSNDILHRYLGLILMNKMAWLKGGIEPL